MNKKEDRKEDLNFEYEIDNFVLETDFKTAIFSPLLDADGNKLYICNQFRSSSRCNTINKSEKGLRAL